MWTSSMRIAPRALPAPFALLCLFLAGAARAQPPADTTETKRSLLAADRALAARVASEGTDALVQALSAQAPVLLMATPLVHGDDARRALRARYASPTSWTPAFAIAARDGRFGCTAGDTEVRPTATGHYITCWRRADANAAWRIVAHIRNDTVASRPLSGQRSRLGMAIPPASASAASDPAGLAEARKTDRAFAALATSKDAAAAFTAFASEDALLLIPPVPRGAAVIGSHFAGFPADRVLVWTPDETLGSSGDGLAVTVGKSLVRSRTDSTRVYERMKYLTVWRKQADGSWRWVLDMGTSRPAEAP